MLDTGVLVLNRVYQPVHITSVRRAFAMLYQGAARAIDAQFQTFDFDSWSALSAAAHRDGGAADPRAPGHRAPGLRPHAPGPGALLPVQHLRPGRQHLPVLWPAP